MDYINNHYLEITILHNLLFFDFKAKSKWNAWSGESGKGKSRTKREYIEYVEILKNKYN